LGFSDAGLEVWAYPLQILRWFGVTFREQAATSEIDGEGCTAPRTQLRRMWQLTAKALKRFPAF
jgi:hypothetical protein